MADDLQGKIDELRSAVNTPVAKGNNASPEDVLHNSISDLRKTLDDTDSTIKADVFAKRQQRMASPLSITVSGQASTAAAAGLLSGVVKGLFSPVASFMPDAFNDTIDAWEEDSARKLLGMQAKSQYQSTYQASPRMSSFLTRSPADVGELAGSLVPFVPTYEAARVAFKVPEALSFSSKVARSVIAGTATGGILSAAAKLDPGESRFAKVALDAAAMGSFELIGIPAMRRAWREESPGLLEKVAAELGESPTPSSTPSAPRPSYNVLRDEQGNITGLEKIEPHLTSIRSGVPAAPEVVDAVLNAAKGDPNLEQTPIVLQAAKQKRARQKLTSPQVIVDPVLGMDSGNLSARVVVTVDGQPVPLPDIVVDPTNPQHLNNTTDKVVDAVKQLSQTGQDVEVKAVVAGTHEDAQNVVDALQGKRRKTPNPDRKKRKVPGAAPEASVAENGDIPSDGAVVNVMEPDKPIVQGTVKGRFVAPVVSPEAQAGFAARHEELLSKYGGKQPAPSTPPVPFRSDEGAADAFAKKYGTVQVEMADKTIRDVPLAQLQAPLEVGVKQSVTLKPHLDGSDRHAIIHLDEGNISFEGRGASQDPNQNYFRNEMFSSTNPDMQWGRDPRLFIHKDGVTISVPSLTPSQPLSRRGFMTSLVKGYSDLAGSLAGKDLEDAALERGYKQIVESVPKEFRSHPLVKQYLDETGDFVSEHMDAGISTHNTLRDLKLYLDNSEKTDTALSSRISKFLSATPESSGVPEVVTAKRAAQVLLKQGVAADTNVAWDIARSTHTPRPGEASLTLKQLAEVELPLANLEKLQDDAAARGLKATPFGTKVTLQSKRGYSRVFANSLEAHEAVLRIPMGKVDRKVEAALEEQWKMGSERAWDPDVDVTRFLPAQAQEEGIKELATGKRPLVPVYTKDPGALNATIRQLEAGLEVPENTFKVRMLPALDSQGRRGAVIYNEGMVATQAAKYRDALNYLGVTAREPGEMIEQLSKKGKGHGIYVLSGRDGESAALYAKWRETGNREFWEKGRIESDTLGPYRRYTKDAKALLRNAGAGDEKYIPIDLADSQAPPAVHFAGDSGDKPRMAEEMAPYEPFSDYGKQPPRYDSKNPPPGEFKDTSGPMAKVFGARFRPMMELSKDWQARTDVPFYEWYRGIEEARNKVDRVVNPILSAVRELAKPLSREERKQAQLLLEANFAGADVSADLQKQLPAKVLHAANGLKEVYTHFFLQEGFAENDIKDFFSIFPHIRKHDGDFRQAIKGRTAVPRIGQLLSKDLDNGAIHIDSRELDFQRIANRVIRGAATERYLQPSWQRVATELEAYSQAKRIPNDYASIFLKHMQEVLHIPDSLHQSLSRGVQQIFSKLGGRLSEIESQDTVSMLIQMNYFTNLGWSPGQVMRNFLQTLQTSLPIIGTKDTMAGWRFGVRWWKDPKLQEEMVRRGVVQADGIYAPLQEVTRLVEGGGGRGSQLLDTFFNKGTKWNANADDFNRVVAYWGQYTRAVRVGKEFLEKKIDWATFLEKSKLDMRDAANGPFVAEVRKALEGGNLEKAAARMGEEFAKATQFVYTRGNAPYVMQSTAGRFFLQYGTWPMWYAENLRNMIARGSYKNRAVALARWTGVQSAMFGTANALFGVDMARWVFFSPLGYQGGPFAQMAIQGASAWQSAVDPTSNDPIARIAKARLASSVVRQVTPLPLGAMTNTFKAVRDINAGSWKDAARQFLGLPAAKGSILP